MAGAPASESIAPMFKLTPPHLIFPRRAGVLAAVAAAAALTAAPAGASVDSTVAAGPNGSATLVWSQGGPSAYPQAHERTLGGNGVLGPMQTVTWGYRNAIEHAVGVDAAGNAVIAWRSADDGAHVAYARRRAADGSLSTIQRLSPAGVSVDRLKLAVEPDGDAVAIWQRVLAGNHVIQARRRAADGSLGPVVTMSYAGGLSGYADVAVAPNGAATVAWVRMTSDDKFVQTRTLAPDNSLSDYQRLSPPSDAANDPTVTVSDTGNAVIGWARSTPDGYVFESRARAATGALGTVQTIAAPDTFSGNHTLAGNGAGRTAYAWLEYHVGTGQFTVKGRVRRADGTLGPVFDVDGGVEPRVAIDPQGNTTFVWRVEAQLDSVRTRRRTAAGGFGPTRILSDETVNSTHPHLAVDSGGKATVAWTRGGGLWLARTVTPGGTVSALHELGPAGG